MSEVTVAIPVRDGGELFAGVLDALQLQTVRHELLVCDSGSSDGSDALARARGARVIERSPSQFRHGATRNLLMAEATGSRVALLTQDAQPADEHWLERLLAGLELAPDVAIAYGRYSPRPSAGLAVSLELEHWFDSLSPNGEPRVERLGEHELTVEPTSAASLMGRRGFFTDANACISRAAWQRVPFRDVRYAEDRLLALDMLRAGYGKAYVPAAAVVHSHDYSTVQELRRAFDEWRALREIYGWREPADPASLLRSLRGPLGQARRELPRTGMTATARSAALVGVGVRQSARLTGAVLGSRADLLPAWLRRALSLERSEEFSPVNLYDSSPGPEPLEPAR